MYHRLIRKNGADSLLLHGYGAYRAIISPYFSTTHLSLLGKDFIYAIAYIHGGEYLGRN